MAEKFKVPVFDGEKLIARVWYNEDLDYYTSQGMQNGGEGWHKGLAKLKNGDYVIIHGGDFANFRPYGEVVTPEKALREILRTGNEELLEWPKYQDLKQLSETCFVEEA